MGVKTESRKVQHEKSELDGVIREGKNCRALQRWRDCRPLRFLPPSDTNHLFAMLLEEDKIQIQRAPLSATPPPSTPMFLSVPGTFLQSTQY